MLGTCRKGTAGKCAQRALQVKENGKFENVKM